MEPTRLNSRGWMLRRALLALALLIGFYALALGTAVLLQLAAPGTLPADPFFLLIALMGQISWLGGVAMAPVSILLSLFIMLLEVLVAFIQAYIFTLLSAIFIGMYAHPAH